MRSLVIATLAVGLLLRPGSASACDDCEGGLEALEPAFAAELPADGVLAFFESGGYGFNETIAIEVRPAGGEPIAGAIHYRGAMILWLPAAPLEAGQSYAVHVHVDNSNSYACYELEDLDVDAAFTAIAAGARPQPRWDAIEVRHWVEAHPSRALDDLVCCEGSRPGDSYCGAPPSTEGCAATRGVRRLHAEITIDPTARAEALGQLDYGQFPGAEDRVEVTYFDGETPLPCVALRATDLATGELHEGPVICPDPALEAELGEVTLDPRETLECESLQVCEIRETDVFAVGWDPDDCRRWRGEGCGCVAAGPRPAAPLLLGLGLGLLALARGRRRR